MKHTLILLALIMAGCSSSRMIRSEHGPIHRFQKKNIESVSEYFEYDDYARQINHRNNKGILTPNLTWNDLQILNIDSLKAKFLWYNAERF